MLSKALKVPNNSSFSINMSISVTELNTNEIINSLISESSLIFHALVYRTSGHEYLDYLNLVLVKPCF